MPEHEQTDGDPTRSDGDYQNRESFEVVATIKIPTHTIHKPAAHGNQEEPPRPWWRQLTTWTGVAAICGAGIALVAVRFNYRAMVGAQRAIVWFDNQAPNTADDMVTLYVRNFGHSPAFDVRIHPSAAFGDGETMVLEEGTARFIPPDRMISFTMGWQRTRNGKTDHAVQIRVVLTFRDPFGDHAATFCVFPHPASPGEKHGTVTDCGYGDSADY